MDLTKELDAIDSYAHNLHGLAQTTAERLSEAGEFAAAGRVLLLGRRAYYGILEIRTEHSKLFREAGGAAKAAKPAGAKRSDAAVPCAAGGRHKWGPDGKCTREGCTATNPRLPGVA